jgi:CrcB protein
MKLLLLVGAGGAIGSMLRHLVNVGFGRWLGAGFPWSTLFVNVAGSLAMGMLAELIALRFGGSPELRAFLMTGILGGFTTFSAFSLDFAALVAGDAPIAAALYVGASVVVSILALYLGVTLARGALG